MDVETWKNFEDYEDYEDDFLKEGEKNQKLYLILGICGAVGIGIFLAMYLLCQKFGFPIVWRDLVLCFRRQMSEFRAWITGDDITPVFRADSIEMTLREDTNDGSKSYSSIGLMRSYSWPLMSDNKSIAHNEASPSVSLA